MISAKQAKNTIKEIKSAEEQELRDRHAKEKVQHDINFKKAMSETYPLVMTEIEKQITEAVNKKEDYIYFKFTHWMRGELLYLEVKKELQRHGYSVTVECYIPTEGGDSDNGGYGGWRTGPNEYSLSIYWKD